MRTKRVDLGGNSFFSYEKLILQLLLLAFGNVCAFSQHENRGITFEELIDHTGSKEELNSILSKYARVTDSTESKAGDSIIVYNDVIVSGFRSYIILNREIYMPAILVEIFYNDSVRDDLVNVSGMPTSGNQDLDKCLDAVIKATAVLQWKEEEKLVSAHFKSYTFKLQNQTLQITYTPKLYLFVSIE